MRTGPLTNHCASFSCFCLQAPSHESILSSRLLSDDGARALHALASKYVEHLVAEEEAVEAINAVMAQNKEKSGGGAASQAGTALEAYFKTERQLYEAFRDAR
jgi:hypothetical protein